MDGVVVMWRFGSEVKSIEKVGDGRCCCQNSSHTVQHVPH